MYFALTVKNAEHELKDHSNLQKNPYPYFAFQSVLKTDALHLLEHSGEYAEVLQSPHRHFQS